MLEGYSELDDKVERFSPTTGRPITHSLYLCVTRFNMGTHPTATTHRIDLPEDVVGDLFLLPGLSSSCMAMDDDQGVLYLLRDGVLTSITLS
jgi:hypothetical protein